MQYYNMTVVILAGNEIYFAADLITIHMPGWQLILCVRNMSVCYHTLYADHWHSFVWFHKSLVSKQHHNCQSCLQICCRYVLLWYNCFAAFKHANVKALRKRATSTTSLDDGNYGSCFEYHIRLFQLRILTLMCWNKKWHVIIVIKTGS